MDRCPEKCSDTVTTAGTASGAAQWLTVKSALCEFVLQRARVNVLPPTEWVYNKKTNWDRNVKGFCGGPGLKMAAAPKVRGVGYGRGVPLFTPPYWRNGLAKESFIFSSRNAYIFWCIPYPFSWTYNSRRILILFTYPIGPNGLSELWVWPPLKVVPSCSSHTLWSAIGIILSSVCLWLWRCTLWLSGLVYMAKSCTGVFLAGMFLFVPSDTFTVGCIV